VALNLNFFLSHSVSYTALIEFIYPTKGRICWHNFASLLWDIIYRRTHLFSVWTLKTSLYCRPHKHKSDCDYTVSYCNQYADFIQSNVCVIQGVWKTLSIGKTTLSNNQRGGWRCGSVPFLPELLECWPVTVCSLFWLMFLFAYQLTC
jgi:hypothetical protein